MMARHIATDEFLPDDVVNRVLRGETNAFEAIVRRFERPQWIWLATQAPPTADVDELTQRNFMAAFS